uniref:Probable glutamine--tRNA ligase n=1 Tax=Plectus sambesii TaxID=2011161 RepID=A0A914VYG5_9BILA
MSVNELVWLGLSEQKAKETLKNAALTAVLKETVDLAKKHLPKDGAITKQQGTLLYQVGTRIKPQIKSFMDLVVKHICNGNIRNEPQVTAALEYLTSNVVSGVDEKAFMAACGAGVVVTEDQIEDQVTEVISRFKPQIIEERYSFNMGKLMTEVKKSLPWADGSMVKKEVDLRVLELLGPKTADELTGQAGKKKAAPTTNGPAAKDTSDKKKGGKPAADKAETGKNDAELEHIAEDGAATIEELMRKKTHFHKVGDNFKTDGYVVTENTMKLLAQHVKDVGGKVVTRFPPEPNGMLHIGHAKAININFGYAKAHGGECNLRFDDTNPEKEEAKFFLAIEEMVGWLGYKPARVTHSSDVFDQLYDWAVVLIKKNLAYICHQTVEEMRGFDVKPSPWRERPIEESLQLFEDMRKGKIEEGGATLRLKTTLEEGKMDPVAYRIKFVAHHRTGDKWCIYPTYDYTHCLCDSIENITHSLCTKEFQSRRSSYYWLCNALDIFCPVQWEYGRLSVSYTVTSKRKIQKLIANRIVRDFDDPRLFTLTGLRRRGVPPEAINNFVARLGLTMAQMVIDPHALDAAVRDELNATAKRTMAVLEPIRVTIENWSSLAAPSSVEVPDFPSEPERSGKHNVAFDRTVFIERDDFRAEEEKGFRRLTPKQSVGLKHVGYVLTFKKAVEDASGQVSEIIVTAEKLSEENKPKAFIHWVAKPVTCEVRLYDRLFNHKNPEDPVEVPGGFLSDCNMDSLKVLDSVLIDASAANVNLYDKFQFERIGFFSVDPDTTPNKIVFNRTVLLKEDSGKKK